MKPPVDFKIFHDFFLEILIFFVFGIYFKYGRNKVLIFIFFCFTEKAVITHHLLLLRAASHKAMNTI